MNSTPEQSDLSQSVNARSLPNSDVSPSGFVRLLRRNRALVFALTFGAPFLAAVVLLFTPNKFTANGVALVETPEGGLGSDLIAQITAVSGLTPQIPPTEMYLAILRSDRAAIVVADSLGLAAHYKVKSDTPEERVEKTLRKMSKRISFDTPDLVSIKISAKDRSPTMAAAIVNAYLHALEKARRTLALTRARQTRTQVEGALARTKAELDSTRHVLQRFQEQYGVFSIDKQTEGALELIGDLQTELLTAQAKRQALGGFSSENAGQVRKLDLEIGALKAQIQRLMEGVKGDGAKREESLLRGAPRKSFFIPMVDLPRLAGEYARILMDLKVQEAKYNVLATQLEQTKIEESESIPAFDVLDWARVPHRKSGPRRMLYVLAAFLGGLLTSILLVVFLDDLGRRIDAETRGELAAMAPGFLRNAFRRLLGRRRES